MSKIKDPSYVYSGDSDPGWQLEISRIESSPRVSSCTLHNLCKTGYLDQLQRIRKLGSMEWKPLVTQIAEIDRIAFGQLLPKVFSKGKLWYLKDRDNCTQGPFTDSVMMDWLMGGYLYKKMEVCGVDASRVAPERKTLFPPDDDFLSLEEMLLYLTQPIFGSMALAEEKPLKDLSIIHGRRNCVNSFVGDKEDVTSLGLNSRLPVRSADHTKTRDEVENAAREAQRGVDEMLVRAVQRFCNGNKMWYYLDSVEEEIIFGPYEGDRMATWFRNGQLPWDLKVWSALGSVHRINTLNFRTLKEVING